MQKANWKLLNVTLKYASPNFSGFTADLAYGFGEVAGNTSASRTLGGTLAYANGPLAVKLAHHNGRNATDTDAVKNSYLGGSYNFGPAKGILGYQIEKGLGSLDRNAALIGAQVPFGPHTIMATYVHKNDKAATNNDANLVGVAYTLPYPNGQIYILPTSRSATRTRSRT